MKIIKIINNNFKITLSQQILVPTQQDLTWKIEDLSEDKAISLNAREIAKFYYQQFQEKELNINDLIQLAQQRRSGIENDLMARTIPDLIYIYIVMFADQNIQATYNVANLAQVREKILSQIKFSINRIQGRG